MNNIKVLFVHNYYQQSGGEDKVVDQEMRLLKSNGIDVNLFSVHNDSIKEQGIFGKIKIAAETSWSYKQYKIIKHHLMETKPDVVHIHNFFPLISPSIYYACSALKIPVVQTLHNYRLICPKATFLKDNKICEACLKGTLFNSVKNGCYHESRFQTIPVASMILINRLIGTWNNKVNRFIALTDFSKKKFGESGILSKNIVVKPNFINRKQQTKKVEEDKYLLFVGRISIEKGVNLLLKAWNSIEDKQNTKLIIIGDGPEKEVLEMSYKSKDTIFLGKQSESTVLSYMQNAKYLIVPSIWYEGFPMTIIEAFSIGTPVICSNIGSLQEIVNDGATGFHFEYNNPLELAKIIRKALIYENYKQLKENVYMKFNENYTPEINFKELIGIYKEVIEENRNAILSKK